MKEMSLEEVQKADMALLDDIDAFCTSKGIRYFLAYGSLLGAMRHGGFIPWDDDMDIWMLRADYERFMAEYVPTKSTAYVLRPYTKGFGFGWLKVVDGRTAYRNKRKQLPESYGLTVDIFPLDPVGGKAGFNIHHKLEKLVSAANVRRNRNADHHALKGAVSKVASVIPGLANGIISSRFIPTNSSASDGGNLVNYYSEYSYAREIKPATAFSNALRVPFKGSANGYLIPAGWERILEITYGDWHREVINDRHALLFWRDEYQSPIQSEEGE